MPIAFVVSTPEEEIINSIRTPGTIPGMNGSTFKFNTRDIPDLIDSIREAVADNDLKSERFNASVRLQERLGSWVGQEMAARAADSKAAYKGRGKNKPKADVPSVADEVDPPVADDQASDTVSQGDVPSVEDDFALVGRSDVT